VLTPREEKRALTALEEKLFAQLVETHEHGLFFKVLYYTGMRPEEARALTIQDIDLKHNRINIDKAHSLSTHRGRLKGCKSKKSIRKVPMPAPLKAAIIWAQLPADTTLLFPGKPGRFMNRDEYTAIYNDFDTQLNALAGGTDTIRAVDRFTPGILRHNFATMMAEAGFAPKYLMEIMGHSSIEVTMKYYVHISDRLREKSDARLTAWSFDAESQVSQNSVN